MQVPRILMVFSLSVIPACGPPWGPPPDPAELMNADRAFAQATAERGADGWADWFAASGRMYRTVGYVDGRTAIRAAMVPALSDSTRQLRWTPDTAVVGAAGDIGYTLGHWESVLHGTSGDSVVGRGNYVTIWGRQSDGTWKVVLDIGNQARLPAQ
jgi:ketosteroid isomerase-like protein